MREEDFICPSCGADVPAKAQACPECGADEKTGWSDDTIYDGTGIEDPDEFDYDDWQRQEGAGHRKRSCRELAVWMAVLLMLALLLWLLCR